MRWWNQMSDPQDDHGREHMDDIDITQLEQLLHIDGKQPSKMTADEFRRAQTALDDLTDRYGEQRTSALLQELTEMTVGQIHATLPLGHRVVVEVNPKVLGEK